MLSATKSDQRALAAYALSVIAEGLAATVDVENIATPATGTRDYTQLLETDEYNAWMIVWAPSGALEPHDHGGSRGAVRVVAGRLCETYADDPGQALRTRVADGGQTLDIPSHRIHEVWNPTKTVAVSVHVYSPPLRDMNFYELD